MRAPSKTHRRAKGLRAEMSLPEVLLWTRLRPRQADTPIIRRQPAIGPYVVDFYRSDRAPPQSSGPPDPLTAPPLRGGAS